MRAARSERYGRLRCGACTERQRDEFRCVLKGHERPPLPVAGMKVDMGTSRSLHFDRCPVGTVMTTNVQRWLSAYALRTRFGIMPPGRTDPRTLDAFIAIALEHEAIDRENAGK